jgi:hypothetical protein
MNQTPVTPRVAVGGRAGWLRRTTLMVAVPAVLGLVLAACGGGTSGPDPSGSGQGSSASGSSASGPVEFAQCMRSHGVIDFPDPQNGHFLISGNVQSSPNFHSAVQACQHFLGPGGATNGGGNGGGPSSSQLLQLAHCMQTHGVPQFPDPTANGAIGLPQGVDPNSPAFQKAWQQCAPNLQQP